MKNEPTEQGKRMTCSRRDFLKYSGIVVIGAGVGGCVVNNGPAASRGYLVVDTGKCQGCMSCMLACSLVHEGAESLSLSRIQVVQDPFVTFPDDINLSQCRQCVEPACLEACPVGALYADRSNGYVRTVDPEKCIGCGSCVRACPYEPGRSIWNFERHHAQKCDLCARADYWNESGGPGGRQACVTICPMKAIQFTAEIPDQTGDEGYNINLRDESWAALGYTTE